MECPRCGFEGYADGARCPRCGAGPAANWPPAPTTESAALTPDDGVSEALHQGWRLILLSLFCAPPVFLPLAVWQGVQANRRSAGDAGNTLLMVCAGVGAFWLAALLLWLRFGK